MSVNRGKDFEGVVKYCLEQHPDVYVLRLYDPQGGYASVSNPCDFIVYRGEQMYMLECKSLHGNTLSISSNDPKRKYGKISNTQWEEMLRATSYGIVAGVLVWWIDADVTRFIPIRSLQRLYDAGYKSVRYDKEVGTVIPGQKKRVYFDYDFNDFFDEYE